MRHSSFVILLWLATLNTELSALFAASGPVAWWRAEGNAHDSAGTNNGVLVNETAFAPGVEGQAFSFEASMMKSGS